MTSENESSPLKCFSDSFKKMYRLMFRNHIENAGKRQSPIDIKTEKCTFDKQKCDTFNFQIKSSPGDLVEMQIFPAAWKAIASSESKTSMSGPHLPGTFQLAQFHAHWASSSDLGSEHTVDGKSYGGEVHFVFWNTKYGTCDVASAQPDGLAVLAVFLTEGKENEEFKVVVELVEKCRLGKEANFPTSFEIKNLIPSDSEYFTYEGSLTTAPFSETVIWTVLMKPVEISKKQFDVFRQICAKNCRDCQPLHNRSVLSSMEFNIV